MPTKPMSRCTQCKRRHSGTGKCDDCRTAARRESDAKRGGARQRGYDTQHEKRFRAGVLDSDPFCVCPEPWCDHAPGECGQPSTVADHHPLSRRQLVAAGLDPNDPDHGRGLCKGCHDRATARHQPGGWNQANGTR